MEERREKENSKLAFDNTWKFSLGGGRSVGNVKVKLFSTLSLIVSWIHEHGMQGLNGFSMLALGFYLTARSLRLDTFRVAKKI